MKNIKKPTREQKALLKKQGLEGEWYVIKNTSTELIVISKEELDKGGKNTVTINK